jgi:hypothetical protein
MVLKMVLSLMSKEGSWISLAHLAACQNGLLAVRNHS